MESTPVCSAGFLDDQDLDLTVSNPAFDRWQVGRAARELVPVHAPVPGKDGSMARAVEAPAFDVRLQDTTQVSAYAGERTDSPVVVDDHTLHRPG